MKKTIDGALFLALFTAILYGISTTYYYGFLTEIGLDPDMMERSFYQTLYQGFLIILFNSLPLLKILFLLLFLVAIPALLLVPIIVGAEFIQFKGPRRRLIQKLRVRLKLIIINLTRELHRFRNFLSVVLYLLSPLLILIFINAFLGTASQGEKAAKEILTQHLTDTNPAETLITVLIHKEPKRLRHIKCGAKHCAGIEPKTNIIYYFPQNIGFNFSYQVKNNTGDDQETKSE